MLWDQARAAHMDIALDIKSAAQPEPGSREGLITERGIVCAAPVCLGQRGKQGSHPVRGDGAALNREIAPRAGGAPPSMRPPRVCRHAPPRDFLETEPRA